MCSRTDAFAPGAKVIHVDIDPSSINKNIRVDVPIIGCGGISERHANGAVRPLGARREDQLGAVETKEALDRALTEPRVLYTRLP